ncbi:MAG: biotin/lipoyl-binding protein [Lachnospiraceae bacterium]|nr:biotin/lipoyl-binding protein [Lachnospiraceae bacterium]
MSEKIRKFLCDWKSGNRAQGKVLKAAIWFFLVLFVCGLISRGMYGAMLPRVEVESPGRIYLNHKVEAEGKVVENKKTAVLAETGIRIEAVLVKEGQSVKKDEPLVQLDLSDLEDLIEDKEIEIEKNRIQIETMEKNEALAANEKAVNQKRANEDYESARQKGDISLGEIQDKLNEAKAEREKLPSQKEYVTAAMKQDEEYQAMLGSLEEKKKQLEDLKSKEAASEEEKEEKKKTMEDLRTDIAESRAALSSYKEKQTAVFQQEWETKKAQLDQNISDYEKESRQASMQKDEDIRSAGRVVEDANMETAADSSLELARLEKRELEKQLNTYKKIKEEGGKILAPVEGDIIEIHAVEGDRTGDSALLHMTDREEGYRFQAEISKGNKKYVQLGDLAEVELGSDQGTLSDIPVETIEESKEQKDTYILSFPVTKEMANLGDTGIMRIIVSGEEKKLCVPLSAIHSDGQQNYVFSASIKKTILGEELKVVRHNVTILDKNETYAAIDQGSISEEDKIIVSSTKQIEKGDTVRLSEE